MNKEKIEKEIRDLEVELVMANYHDGWTADWIRERLVYLKEELSKIENNESK